MHISIQYKVLKVGFNSFQIKIIALICMTFDHIAAYGFEIPFAAIYARYFRMIGRVAAPLFLFILIKSIRYTRNRVKFILRLYIAGMLGGIFGVAANLFLGNVFTFVTLGNITFTFFYIALYIHSIVECIEAIKTKNARRIILFMSIMAVSFIPNMLTNQILHTIPRNSTMAHIELVSGIVRSFLPSNTRVDYGLPFIVLGIAMYFVKDNKAQCAVFALFCIICIIGASIPKEYFSISSTFSALYFNYYQCYMIAALPFMMFYTDQRGKTVKWLFYVYYPVHCYLIFLISKIITWV